MSTEQQPDTNPYQPIQQLVIDGLRAIATSPNASPATQLRALELLFKHAGMAADPSTQNNHPQPEPEPLPIARFTPSLDPDDGWDARWQAYVQDTEDAQHDNHN